MILRHGKLQQKLPEGQPDGTEDCTHRYSIQILSIVPVPGLLDLRTPYQALDSAKKSRYSERASALPSASYRPTTADAPQIHVPMSYVSMKFRDPVSNNAKAIHYTVSLSRSIKP